MFRTLTASLVLALVFATTVRAEELHGGDVALTVVNGKITTNALVYGAELGEIIPNETDEPGYDSLAGTFPTGSAVGFRILDALRMWDGSDFDTIPVQTMGLTFSSLGPIVTPATADTIVPGFTINVAANGSWHRHLIYTLNAPASDGIYLLKLELFSTSSLITDSDPFYIVFNQNDTELNHDAAIEYVESTAIPTPTSFALAAISSLALLNKKRRR